MPCSFFDFLLCCFQKATIIIVGDGMTRHSMQLTRFVECGPVFKKGKRFVDASDNPLHGIYHAEQESAVHAIIFIQGGRVADYGYPRVDRMFASPMINDFNLHFIGRWQWPFENEGDALVERIAEYLKPAGLITASKDQGPGLLQKARDAGLGAVFQDDEPRGVQYLGFAVRGTFIELFDLDSLVADYKAYEREARFLHDDSAVDIELMIASIKNDSIMSHVERFLCMNPGDIADIITSGLIFGYPIETTVAFLAGTIT